MMLSSVPSTDFALGETADAIRETTSRFSADRIAPLAAKIDESNAFPRSLWPEMGALGLHSITVEEKFGGLGLGYLEQLYGIGAGTNEIRRFLIGPELIGA